MKKIVLSLLGLIIYIGVNAQDTIYIQQPPPPQKQHSSGGGMEKRINLYGAYVFDDNFNSSYDYDNYYDGKLKGGFQYGAGIEFMVKRDYGVELLYIGQNTTAPTTYASSTIGGGVHTANLDVNLNYALLGFGRKVGSDKAEGYGGLMLGALFADATNPSPGIEGGHRSAVKFAWGLRLGGNIWVSEKVGIKLQAQLLSATQAAGGGLYFGTGGVGAGVSTYSTFYQFALGGGLVFRMY